MAKVTVPQASGDIVLTSAGEPPATYAVTDNQVDVPDEHVYEFLRYVPGAELAQDAAEETAAQSGGGRRGSTTGGDQPAA